MNRFLLTMAAVALMAVIPLLSGCFGQLIPRANASREEKGLSFLPLFRPRDKLNSSVRNPPGGQKGKKEDLEARERLTMDVGPCVDVHMKIFSLSYKYLSIEGLIDESGSAILE